MAKVPTNIKLTQDKIVQVLQDAFEGMIIEFDPYRRDTKLHGILAWPGFDGMAQIDRQRLVRQALRQHLTEEQDDLTGLLLTVTPQELAGVRDAA